jgi:hypothetical protein
MSSNSEGLQLLVLQALRIIGATRFELATS